VADILSLWPVLLFWPPVGLSLLTAGLGLVRGRVSLLVTVALLVSPAALYLIATPHLRYTGWLPILGYLLTAIAVRRGHARAGWVLATAVAAFFGWLALTVLAADPR
jgi:hypothetical protein